MQKFWNYVKIIIMTLKCFEVSEVEHCGCLRLWDTERHCGRKPLAGLTDWYVYRIFYVAQN